MGVLQPHGRGRRLFWADGLSAPNAPTLRPPGEGWGEGAPVIIIHSLAHAIGALTIAARVGRPITVLSATDAGIYAGPGWFRALVEAAREAVPGARFSAILDCGDAAGAALAAIRAQIEGVIFIGRTDVARRLGDIARQHGVRLETTRPTAALDLGADFFASAERIEQRCAEVLVDEI
jgi:delta 1-pyrroline-5-carboxylate dehydrogenase